MTWMLTYSGHTVELSHMDAAQMPPIGCIAHALATINRFTGHARRPYSVAEHSLLVCEILQREFAVHDPAILMAGLLHDAHEALVGDMSQPVKESLRVASVRLGIPCVWDSFERRLQADLMASFGVHDAAAAHARLIHDADMLALSCERRDLMPAGGPQWPVSRTHPAPTWVNLFAQDGMDWQDWKRAFADRFDDLSFALALHREPVVLDPRAGQEAHA